MNNVIHLNVQLGDRSYPILIGPGLLDNVSKISEIIGKNTALLVTNKTIWPIYGQALFDSLEQAGRQVLKVILDDGESFKDWHSLNHIFDALLDGACDRNTILMALGGGVIGDITGFAAATYQRGIDYIQIPTTLLAQVDSSVGGKTAINHPSGKNMIGAFHQPRRVIMDTRTLVTLPAREYQSGFAEVIKYALIADPVFFTWLESNIEALNNRDEICLTYAIKRSCEIKATIVAADERETDNAGGRALLNLGHTFGHAIETALGYGAWLHGEAVACGMMLAANLSAQLGHLNPSEVTRVERLLLHAGLPTHLPDVPADKLIEIMRRDKKNQHGAIRLVLLKSIGCAYLEMTQSAAKITEFLNDFSNRIDT